MNKLIILLIAILLSACDKNDDVAPLNKELNQDTAQAFRDQEETRSMRQFYMYEYSIAPMRDSLALRYHTISTSAVAVDSICINNIKMIRDSFNLSTMIEFKNGLTSINIYRIVSPYLVSCIDIYYKDSIGHTYIDALDIKE